MREIALENKFGIKSISELARVEERVSKQAIIKMWENDSLNNFVAGSFELLQYIHFNSFKDVYSFAGKIRDVQIGKDDFAFCDVRFINTALEELEKMPQSNIKEIIDKYAELNIIHPFREGNGRTTRLWLDHLLKTELNVVVDWNNIGKVDYFNAMVKSHLNTDDLVDLVSNNLTNEIYDRQIFFKGLDSSYWYENMSEFETEEVYNDLTNMRLDNCIDMIEVE